MKIKRYMAASMRAALALVRSEQGPDAVILSSRRVEEGIEVIAAVDYDEALFVDATLKKTPAVPDLVRPAEPAPVAAKPVRAAVVPMPAAPQVIAPVPAVAARRAPAPSPAVSLAEKPRSVASRIPVTAPPAQSAPVRSAPQSVQHAPRSVSQATQDGPRAPQKVPSSAPPARAFDAGYLAMHRELKDLREMLQGELAHMGWNDKRLRDPLQARVLEQLTAMDIAPDIANALAAKAPQHASVKNREHIPLTLLLRYLRTVEKSSALNSGVIALVGPTGAGKTTTIAKLAARWTMQYGSKDLALVSTDGYRIGAREQLATYARILGAPMHSANNGKELSRVLERLRGKKMVLIDTAGMGPRDVRLSEHLSELQLGAAGARVLLALPAQGEGHALEEIVKSFARVAPSACILTKLDEAASLGAVLSTTLRHRLPIAYLCNGQRVPEDVHSAHERRVWLIRAALKLKERSPTQFNESYFANNFGRATAHA
jgi:flagellar biosynthesis protein FlhF